MKKNLALLGALLMSNLFSLTAQPYPANNYNGSYQTPNGSYQTNNTYSSSNNNYSYNSNQTQATNSINWVNNYSEAVKQSQMSSKPILILFTGTNWCPACMRLEREVLKKPEFARAVGDKFIFLKLDFPAFSDGANRSPNTQLAERYGVSAFPTIIIANANGQRLFRVDYQAGGPQFYINELTQKLNQQNQSQYYTPQG